MKNIIWRVIIILLTVTCCILGIAIGTQHNTINLQKDIINRNQRIIGVQDEVIDRWRALAWDIEKVLFTRNELLEEQKQKAIIQRNIIYIQPTIRAIHLNDITYSVYKYSKQEDVEANLILALIYIESSFNPEATSYLGARGLMQVMPFWANSLEYINYYNDFYDIDTNIRAGIEIFQMYMEKFDNDQKLALLAYNRGPSAVMQDIQQGLDPSNGYDTAVLQVYNKLVNL
jgi:soluble lytic murein transglycosylase-like protein